MFTTQDGNPKERKADRILELKVIDGQKPKSSTGLIDSRLFTGGNKLHAIMDQQTTLWKLKYEDGSIPEPLRQQFTSFAKLKEHCELYFAGRNLEIEKVID